MKVEDVFGSQDDFLKVEHLQGKKWKVTIGKIEPVEFKGAKKLKIELQGRDKIFICNVTNARRIAEYYGDDFETWFGREITLMPDRDTFEGKMVDCIRVEQKSKDIPEGNLDDEIPF